MPNAPLKVRSADNAFQHIEVLKRNRVRRQQCREFFVEGVRPIEQLVAGGWNVVSLWSEAGRAPSPWARKILATADPGVHYLLAPHLMARLSDKEEPSELLAVAKMAPDDLGRVAWRPGLVVVVFDRPSSPGNLGTLIRSADGLGADALLVSGHAADIYDPQTIRASMGSLFALPVLRVPGAAAVAAWLDALPVRPLVVGTDSRGAVGVNEAGLTGPVAIVAGNESAGMSHDFRELCDVVVRVPLQGSGDSLNVATAASIVLYETWRQRLSPAKSGEYPAAPGEGVRAKEQPQP